MPLSVESNFRVRGSAVSNDLFSDRDTTIANINGRGEALVAAALPPLTEAVRLGNSYWVATSSAAAPVVALPTTTAQLTLWNGENDGGKSYVIDSVWAMVVVSAAAATPLSILGCLNIGKQTKPTGTLTPKSMSGRNYRGQAQALAGATIVNDGWLALGSGASNTPTSHIGLTVDIPLNGSYIVPPGGMFSTAVIANTASTITCIQGIRWHEVTLALG